MWQWFIIKPYLWPVMFWLLSSSIIILDHHKTSVEMFSHVIFPRQNVHVVIDMNRSGATIAYDFFKEKLSQEKTECNNFPYGNMIDESEIERINYLFKLIEDGDLWRWALPNSKAFSSGLKDLNIEFNANLNPCLFHQVNLCLIHWYDNWT